MGRSYHFECARCGYRAKVSGRSDRGLDLFIQTIVCWDCKQLYDVVTRIRFPETSPIGLTASGSDGMWSRSRLLKRLQAPKFPPSFQAALNRLRTTGIRHSKWVSYPLQCPVSWAHKVQRWAEPGKCPRCGTVLGKNVLPYRIWD